MEEKVMMPESRYTELIENTVTLNVLVKWLFNNATTAYNNTELRFNDVEDILSTMFPEKYAGRLKELKEGEQNV